MDTILSRPIAVSDKYQKIAVIAALLISIFILAIVIFLALPDNNDWPRFYQPAALSLLSGESPYHIPGLFQPPWAFLPLIPIAVLPWRIGATIMSMVTLVAYAYVAHRLGARPLVLIAILFSPQVLWESYLISLDWMVILGFLMPPQIGLFFVLVKPQLGIGVAIYWLVESLRNGGIRQALETFAPVATVSVISLLVFGPWFSDPSYVLNARWNASLWPYGIPIGIALLAVAIKNKKSGLALSAGPLFAPYMAPHSWIVPVMGLLPAQIEAVAAVLVLWLAWIIGGNQFAFLH